MRCSKCGTDNAAGSRFCTQCATPLGKPCPKCAHENISEAKFCAQCAAPLDATELTGVEAEPRNGGLTGERRHLTVLFCDLVGSTEIAAQLDPEEWRAIVADYHRAVGQAVERFGGYVAQYLGDGVMAFFGYPEAHENDAERAARAGLAILDAISKLNAQGGTGLSLSSAVKLSARVGIDSGAVVVGASAGKEADVFGDVPNIAARVQNAADPDTVMITDATHRLVSGLFVVEDCGAQPLKGIERPVQLYRVIQPSGVRGRLEAIAAARGLTPFVGREDELRLLLSRWERARDGKGQVVMVVGEPGIGKSRLLREFHEQIAGERHVWVESAGEQLAQSRPFYAATEMLRQGIGLHGDERAERLIELLALSLEKAGLKAKQALPLFAPLLNLQVPKNYPPVPAAPEEQRRRLLASLSRWAMGVAETEPAIMVLEDLHWADPSTVEFAKLLVDQAAAVPLMLIYTTRPELPVPWPMRAHHTQVMLDRLSDRLMREMVENIASQKELSADTVETVLRRATGVPLFVEELTRDLLERGERPLPHQIPATLHDSLMARLDRLGSARELAQVGATIGREFSYELLHAVASVSERELQLALDNLVSAELLYARGSPPEASYVFKHALVQDAAYNTLLKSRRRELHRRIAQILAELPESATSAPELLAHHYTEAGLIEQAVRYWRRAGRRATERSAYTEAIAHLSKGLELIKSMPETPELMSEELRLQIALTEPLTATKGYTAPEVEEPCSRAMELYRQIGESPHLFAVLGRLFSIYYNRGELELAHELARHMLRLAERQQDPVLLLWGHYVVGFTLASQAALKPARRHLEQSIAFYGPRKGRTYGYVQDPGPTGLAMLSHVVHSLGYPDQALEKMQQAVAMARNLSHPFTLAWVLSSAGHLNWRRGEKLAAQELWEETYTLCIQQGFTPRLQATSLLLGFALVEQGRGEDGIAKAHNALYGMTDTLTLDDRVRGLGLLALAEGKVGQAERGLAKIDEALALAKKTKRSEYESDLYLAKGQLLLMKNAGGRRKARQCFRMAIHVARDQKAKSDELAAVIQLARLLVSNGHREQARAMLAEIYGWFTEGFDTADLKDAKALLDELSA
jgi:class 3 adenylate cyclase/tetratricopeptide (TPR) repeat protein